MHLRKVDSLLFTYDIAINEATQNWNNYAAITMAQTDNFVSNDYFTLNHIVTVYLLHITDTKALQDAVAWANKSLALHEEYNSYLLCAKVYQKTGDKKTAMLMAQKGKDLAQKSNWDFNEADALLKQLR